MMESRESVLFFPHREPVFPTQFTKQWVLYHMWISHLYVAIFELSVLLHWFIYFSLFVLELVPYFSLLRSVIISRQESLPSFLYFFKAGLAIHELFVYILHKFYNRFAMFLEKCRNFRISFNLKINLGRISIFIT